MHKVSALSEQAATAVSPLARAAVADITSGMVVGLGTGRTASLGIAALAQRVAEERLDIQCVATSHATETLARALRLPLADFSVVEHVDYLFDGADEVDPELRMIKGRGGALTRERVVAHASHKRVYMVTESKLVARLGEHSTLPVAVHAFGLASIRAHLSSLGLNGVVRRTLSGELFLTDQGNLIIDVAFTNGDPEATADLLDAVPGVIDHGLFLCEADEVLVQFADGRVERRARPDPEPDACGHGCCCH